MDIEKDVKTTYTLKLTGKDILSLLKETGNIEQDTGSVEVTIPSGGDYSGMNLDIDDTCPITIICRKFE